MSSDESSVLPSQSASSDVIAIERMLQTAGIDRYDPHVVSQLLELASRMTRELLVDADDLREHAHTAAGGAASGAGVAVGAERPPVDVRDVQAADAMRAYATPVAPTITQVRVHNTCVRHHKQPSYCLSEPRIHTSTRFLTL